MSVPKQISIYYPDKGVGRIFAEVLRRDRLDRYLVGYRSVENQTSVDYVAEQILAENPLLVFLGVNFGGRLTDNTQGLEVLAKIREEKSDVHAVIIADELSNTLRLKAREAGANGYIDLPVSIDVIKECARKMTSPQTLKELLVWPK